MLWGSHFASCSVERGWGDFPMRLSPPFSGKPLPPAPLDPPLWGLRSVTGACVCANMTQAL